jgi:hypothetical protein
MAYSIWQVGLAMFVYYAALFLACLTGVCAFAVIGNKLRRIYIELVGEYNDIYTSDEPGLDESRHGHFEIVSNAIRPAPRAGAFAMPRSVALIIEASAEEVDSSLLDG